jgi:protein-disulfide isomerase
VNESSGAYFGRRLGGFACLLLLSCPASRAADSGAGRPRGAPPPCRPLDAAAQAVLSSYVAKQLRLPRTEPVTIAADELEAGCYRRLTFRSPSSSATLWLTPDQRFLTARLWDVAQDPEPSIREEDSKLAALLLSGESPARGPRDAAVTLVEFADFQCPFCKNLNGWLKDLPADVAPHVRVVFKHLPLSSHPWARRAAALAACAGFQSEPAFWALGDVFFQQQESLTLDSLRPAAIARLRSLPGALRESDFLACAEGGAGDRLAARDLDLASRLGIRATPTVFINGVRLPALQSSDQLVSRIRDALSARGAQTGRKQ